jgi:hypothetical protein
MPFKVPKLRLLAELGPRVHRLQERSPGVCTGAPSRNGAQSDSQHNPHQLVDDKLSGTNKAKAAHQVKSPKLGMSLPILSLS